MPLRIEFTRRALKDLRRLPAADRERALAKLSAYAEDPGGRHFDVLHLVGSLEGFRLRVGDWRLVFNVTDRHLEVLRVGHRREVYR